MTNAPVAKDHIEALRRFNRFYTQRAGVLQPYLGSELSLTEVRVLYELAHASAKAPCTASALCDQLGLDAGYMSRLLRGFTKRDWIERHPDPQDARAQWLTLSKRGRAVFAPLQRKSQEQAAATLAPLAVGARTQVLQAMQAIQALLAPSAVSRLREQAATLRQPQPGDMGWVVQLHAQVYAREYGWDQRFEGLVAQVAADFINQFQPKWERGWIAEMPDGEHVQRVGAVFVVRRSKTVAQLRMLILAPQARGLGLGARLTDECIAFARAKGYKKMVLWTNACLTAARALYRQRGFALVKSEAHEAFGKPQVSETWELVLS